MPQVLELENYSLVASRTIRAAAWLASSPHLCCSKAAWKSCVACSGSANAPPGVLKGRPHTLQRPDMGMPWRCTTSLSFLLSGICIVSHRPSEIAMPVDFKLHHHRQFSLLDFHLPNGIEFRRHAVILPNWPGLPRAVFIGQSAVSEMQAT
jgi:hypothetical protein